MKKAAKAHGGRRWPKLLGRVTIAGVCLGILGYVGLKLWQRIAVPADAPVVGASVDTAWHARAGITTKNYEIALTRAGAKIVQLRPESGEPQEILDRIDALLLTGGGDIDPELYGSASTDAELVDRGRDEFELALIRGALERDMPVLGICRGIQILNVAAGGTVRNLRHEAKLAEVHGITLSSFDAHEVEILNGSRLARLLGSGLRRANSFHGQAVGQLGDGFQMAARAPDEVVEAIELPERAFVIGMQWHPEIPPAQMAVFEAFIHEARRYRQGRGR